MADNAASNASTSSTVPIEESSDTTTPTNSGPSQDLFAAIEAGRFDETQALSLDTRIELSVRIRMAEIFLEVALQSYDPTSVKEYLQKLLSMVNVFGHMCCGSAQYGLARSCWAETFDLGALKMLPEGRQLKARVDMACHFLADAAKVLKDATDNGLGAKTLDAMVFMLHHEVREETGIL